MRRRRVLFLESESYYAALGFCSRTGAYRAVYDGVRFYRDPADRLCRFDAVVSFNYTSPVVNFLIMRARALGIKTILVADGIFDWSNAFNNKQVSRFNLFLYHPVMHDAFLCVGRRECLYFGRRGLVCVPYLPKRVFKGGPMIPLPGDSTFLITAANSAFFDGDERARLVHLMASSVAAIRKAGHPVIFRIFDDDLRRDIGADVAANYVDGSFDDVLQRADCVLTTPSSISISAMANKRAVGHFNYRDAPLTIQSGWLISTSCDIGNAIKMMAENDVRRMEFQVNEVSSYINSLSPDAALRVAIAAPACPQRRSEIDAFIKSNLRNMLTSWYNINFEFFLRRLYLWLKARSFLSRVRERIRRVVR